MDVGILRFFIWTTVCVILCRLVCVFILCVDVFDTRCQMQIQCLPFNTGCMQVVVQHVHFDGLGRTRDDIIMYEIADVFKAKNLIDVSTVVNNRPTVQKFRS